MKNKKLVVLLSVLAIATTPVVVAMAGCDGNKPDNKTEQTTKYTFSFSGGSGATGSVAAIADKATGDKFNLPENGFTKDGYTFAGWSDGTATTPYAAGAEFTVGTSDVTFTAVWTAIDYTVTFAGGDGATGTVAAITGKHVGDKVTLPANGFTKEGYTFVGWLVGTSETPVAAGTEITMTAADVTVTAAWEESEEGTYTDNLASEYETPCTAVIADGKITITAADYRGNEYETEYSYVINGSEITLTDADEVEYKGAYVDKAIIIAVPVKASSGEPTDTALVLTKTALTLIEDMGGQGHAQTMSFEDHMYMFTNGVFVGFKGYGKDEPSFGTFESKGNHVYELTYNDDGKVTEIKINQLNGVAFYSFSDGFKGTYTLGDKSFVLDGFGNWSTNGTYVAFSDGTNSMIVINDPDELDTYFCNVSGTTLTAITTTGAGEYTTTAEYPMVAKIYFNGANLLGIALSGEEGGEENYTYVTATLTDNRATFEKYGNDVVVTFNDGYFTVVPPFGGDSINYSLNGAELPEPDPAIAAGNYINNLDSTITATVTVNKGISTLTLKSGTTETAYTVSDNNGVLGFKPASGTSYAKGYIVDGVIFITSIKIGSSTKAVALSSEALTSISGVSAGYAVKPGSTSYKLYVFTNNIAVYMIGSSSGKIASYTTSGNNEFALTFADGSAAKTFKVFEDDGDTKAYYMESDGLSGTYTDGDMTIVIDGYGTYTIGTDSGKYNAGKKGFSIAKDNAVWKSYEISGTTLVTPVETPTELVNKGGNANRDLEGKKIMFTGADLYADSGYAVIHYTYNDGEVQSLTVTAGITFTIGDENFVIEKVTNEVRVIRTNEGIESNHTALTIGEPGGAG